MSTPDARGKVEQALDQVINSRTGQGMVASGMIADLAVADGVPAFTVLLRRDDPATLVRQARQALAAAGFETPKIRVADPAGPAPASHPPPQSSQAGVPPAPMHRNCASSGLDSSL